MYTPGWLRLRSPSCVGARQDPIASCPLERYTERMFGCREGLYAEESRGWPLRFAPLWPSLREVLRHVRVGDDERGRVVVAGAAADAPPSSEAA